MARRARLDAELVRRGLARSRGEAAALVDSGRVKVAGAVASKPATAVDAGTPVLVAGAAQDPGYASRGGHKLAGGLDALDGPVLRGRRVLDAGASTGGFTDVLLRRGAGRVVAVDVGYGQLHWRLRTDPRVTVLDRCNVRGLTPEAIGGAVDVTVADLSFISLRLVLPALDRCTNEEMLLLVKPQFEVGRGRVGPGGVVRQPALRAAAVTGVADAAYHLGWGTLGVAASPLPGPAGNVEYFLRLSREAPGPDRNVIERSVCVASA